MERAYGPLEVGLRVSVRPMENPEESFVTRVENITQSSVDVQRPTDQYRSIGFPVGSKVELSVTLTEPPGKEGRYVAQTKVLKPPKGPVPVLRLRMPDTWERTQLREFFRVPAVFPARVRVVSEAEGDGDDRLIVVSGGTEWLTAQTRDISAGGCQLVMRTPMSPGDTVEVDIELPEYQLRARGVVRRSDPDPDEPDYFVVGLSFSNLEEESRQQVLRFAFQRQIELRKKGLS